MRTNRKGRSIAREKHVRLESYLYKSRAYQSLGPEARALFGEFKWRFNGQNNGDIHLSILEAQKTINVGRKRAEKGLWELQDRGFVKIAKKGLFTYRQATTWILTCDPLRDQLPTKDFMAWEPKKQNIVLPRNTNGAPQVHQGPSKRGKLVSMSVRRGHEKAPNGKHHGAPQEHTYSIPGTHTYSGQEKLVKAAPASTS